MTVRRYTIGRGISRGCVVKVREDGSANQGHDDGCAPSSETGDGASGVHHV